MTRQHHPLTAPVVYFRRMPRHSMEPVYRPILRDAFRVAWTEKRYWWVAVLAGITLTASVYDIGWRAFNFGPVTGPGAWSSFWVRAMATWPTLSFGDAVLGSVKVLQLAILFFLVLFTVWALSLIAQAALVYAVGAKRGTRAPSVREAFTVGARSLWPVLVLNLFVMVVLWSVRGLITIALSGAVQNPTPWSSLAYLVAFLAFVIVAAAAVMIQVFALNAMILQGATLAQGLERAAHVLSEHWVVAVEMAAFLFLITLGASVLVIVVNMFFGIPLFFLALVSVLLQSKALMLLTIYVAVFLFIAAAMAVAGFVIQFQYAAWTILYRKLGEGGVLPKIHRWMRWLTHGYRVPGA